MFFAQPQVADEIVKEKIPDLKMFSTTAEALEELNQQGMVLLFPLLHSLTKTV